VQALSEVLQPASMSTHKLSLPAFWVEDLAGWFQHAEAEFTLARLLAHSYVCYVHVICALSSDVLTAVRDLTRDIISSTLSLATTDASDSHVGAVLQQRSRGSWRPLAFFSHKLSPTESRYSTFDTELLAAYLAVRHFRFSLEGRQFTLFTDHKPLVTAISKSGTPSSLRQQRHLSFLSEFTTSFVHLPDSRNVVADALSRPSSTIPSVHLVTTAPTFLFPKSRTAAQSVHQTTFSPVGHSVTKLSAVAHCGQLNLVPRPIA
jgi:hypothetical protein